MTEREKALLEARMRILDNRTKSIDSAISTMEQFKKDMLVLIFEIREILDAHG